MSKGVFKENGKENLIFILPAIILVAGMIGLGREIGYLLGHSFSYVLFVLLSGAAVVGSVMYYKKKGQYKDSATPSLALMVISAFLFFGVLFGPAANRKLDKQANIEYKK